MRTFELSYLRDKPIHPSPSLKIRLRKKLCYSFISAFWNSIYIELI